MTGDDLTRDLVMLERTLCGGCQQSPSLRSRVMDKVQEELYRSQRLAFWQYVSAVAALVLLALNLSISVASMPRQVAGLDRNRVSSLREQISQMQLALSEEDIQQHCLLLAAGEHLRPLAKPYGSSPGTSVLPIR